MEFWVKKMNEKNRARIIEECLSNIKKGIRSEQDCIDFYPELRQELIAVFSVYHELNKIELPPISPKELGNLKNQILFKLLDRDLVVTNPPQFRYRWQNTKRRFAMGWVIIITTIVSLISGAGVVSASNSAIPGDTLYPVKTWVEDVQLAISSDEVDVKLNEVFAGNRIDELVLLIESGETELISQLAERYQNQTELMTQSMNQIEAKNPERAIKLRYELESKLSEQAQIIEGYIQGQNDGENLQLLERLREMLQANLKVRLRANETDPSEDPEVLPEENDLAADVPDDSIDPDKTGINQNQNQNENKVQNKPEELIENDALKFRFEFRQVLKGGVYAMVAGKRYECITDGSQATCDMTGAPGTGNLNLFEKDSNLLLYSYDYFHNYEYLWEGTKDSGGIETQNKGGDENGGGSHENGQGGNK